MKPLAYFLSVFRRWGYPISMGLVYWLFDTVIHFASPPPTHVSFFEALFPSLLTSELLFRLLISTGCIFGFKYLENLVIKLRWVEQQLYLGEYAVEHSTNFAMVWVNNEGRIIKINQCAAKKFGKTKHELLDSSLVSLMRQEDQQLWPMLISKLKKEGNITYRTKQADASGKWIDTVVNLQHLNHGGDQYQFAFLFDLQQLPKAPQLRELLAV